MDNSNYDGTTSQGDTILGEIISALSNTHIFDLIKIAFLFYFILLLLLSICGKRIQSKDSLGNTRERLYKRFLFANYDIIRDLDEEEKKVMTQTFENTVKNAKIPPITKTTSDNLIERRKS